MYMYVATNTYTLFAHKYYVHGYFLHTVGKKKHSHMSLPFYIHYIISYSCFIIMYILNVLRKEKSMNI